MLLASTSPAAAHKDDPGKAAAKLSKTLVREASAEDAYKHLQKFQQLADSAGGDRVAGSPGHDASAAYVYKLLRKAGYRVSYQKFEFVYTQTQAEKISVLSPTPGDVQIKALTYTKSTPVGGVTADLAAVPVDADGTTGCEPGDYAAGAYTGKIALIRRGGCSFAAKQEQAAAAGAIGAVIYNNIDAGYGPLSGTLSDPAAARIPTGGISKADGERLAAAAAEGPVTISFEIRQFQERRATDNVIAETRGGDATDTVMLGAQLDTVPASPGINDDGSGAAGLLDVALKLAEKEKHPRNKVRFAWWSATESGLVGSDYYVAHLAPLAKQQLKLYLHFEMIDSPNYGSCWTATARTAPTRRTYRRVRLRSSATSPSSSAVGVCRTRAHRSSAASTTAPSSTRASPPVARSAARRPSSPLPRQRSSEGRRVSLST
ncbi:M28 family peptidase [Streptomyces sp. NY05-11A]|nr:M28 family peptidase [Streptomyces sp. NY05-11A]MDX2680708.1 M28 family peptidase [Streptomyces sp. NY05-11A]